MQNTETTEGARLLRAKVKKFGIGTVADVVNASVQTMRHWLNGERIPTLPHAVRIQSAYKIQPIAWTIPPKN